MTDAVTSFFADKPEYKQEGWVQANTPYLLYTVIFTFAVFIFEFYLEIRQKKSTRSKQVPTQLIRAVEKVDGSATDNNDESDSDDNDDGDDKNSSKNLMEKVLDKFTKSCAYQNDKLSFSLVSSVYNQTTTVALLLLGWFPYAWDMATDIVINKLGLDAESNPEIMISIVFMALTSLLDTVTSFPFEYYYTFVVEEKHGFNKQTLSLWLTDKVKGMALGAAIGAPVLSAVIWIIKWTGSRFYIYVWAFTFVFSLLMMTIYPTLIAPLFNKYEPLQDGELKTKIEDLAAGVKFPLKKLFVVDGSKRSAHSNAYMYGFGKNKRIVLYDTLIKQVGTEEIVAILGHELGHWKMWHTIQGFVISQVYVFAAFSLFGFMIDDVDLYASFGFANKPILIGLLLFFQTVWAPVDKILSFLMNILSRHNEFAADAFAVSLGRGAELQLGLLKIHLENLGNMNPDRYYSAYHYSHPPLVERLQAMMDAA